ncbi:Transcriptional regulator, LysR family [Labilithrix luteola]|uniref:Transcriptional regulator, LysR family n=1 Tax=Labilithrix luteola TaxID=1391654 RepID=A0A0K1Q4K5_9BACT|nr:LysR family transcriptional regulator [Labilithrix luteola]AKV00320.1 Transcriptional regulator, LysR family [Labilithrix luteola]
MAKQLDLNTVRVFVAVVDKGSFAGAARALSMPTSNVSRYVAQLEANLGVRLLERSSRRTSVTEAGRVLHQRAKPLLDALEQTGSELTQQQGALRGALKVSLPTELGPQLLAPALAEFAGLHPGIQLECDTVPAGVETVPDDVDVAIVVSRGPAEDSMRVMRPLASLPSVVVASPKLVEQVGLPKRTSDLGKLPCITTAGALKGRPWQFIDDQGELRHVRVSSRYRVNSGKLAQVRALQGLGFAILVEFACRADLDQGHLHRVPLDWQPAPLKLWAAYRSRQYLSARVRALLDLIQRRIENLA